MRAKNREINIFNMSLLDILTGMLGAFLFLMVGLVPYYAKVMNSQLITQEEKEKIDELKKLLDKGLKGPLTAEEAEALRKELDRLEAQNARLLSENEDLKEQVDQLQTQLDQTKKDLDAMTADRDNWKSKVGIFTLITASWLSAQADVDLFMIPTDDDKTVYTTKTEKEKEISGRKVVACGYDSHRPGQPPKSSESIAVTDKGGTSAGYFVAYRVNRGAVLSDYRDLYCFASIDDSFGSRYVSLFEGAPSNLAKAEPGKIYIWFKVTYGQAQGIQVDIPAASDLPRGVLLPPP